MRAARAGESIFVNASPATAIFVTRQKSCTLSGHFLWRLNLISLETPKKGRLNELQVDCSCFGIRRRAGVCAGSSAWSAKTFETCQGRAGCAGDDSGGRAKGRQNYQWRQG